MPYAQHVDFGWVIVCEACLGKTHKPPNVNVLKPHVLQNGRVSYLSPCPNIFEIKKPNSCSHQPNSSTTPKNDCPKKPTDQLGQTVFETTKDDNTADNATRPIATNALVQTNWFSGPSFLTQPYIVKSLCDTFTLIDPDKDTEIRPELKSCITKATVTESLCFERFSHWMRLSHTITSLKLHLQKQTQEVKAGSVLKRLTLQMNC